MEQRLQNLLFGQYIKNLSLMTIFSLFILQGCAAVDPLDPASNGNGPPTKGDANYSVCSDATLVDTDKDGMNDECEKKMGIKKENDPDCNNNGIPDGKEILGPNCTEIPPPPQEPACPPVGVTISCEEYTKEQNGLKNKSLNEIKDGSLLASSGLNASAPNGTSVHVDSQFIRIVVGNPAANSGIQTQNEPVCAGLTNFIYYRIEGDIQYLTGGDGATDFGPVKHSVMKLCGPLTLTSNNPGSAHIENSFKWTKGWVQGEAYKGFFDPQIYNKGNTSVSDTKLTLTPSNMQSGIYKNMSVKFDSVLRIKGTIYVDDGSGFYNMKPVEIDTTKPITVFRNFKRGAPDIISTSSSPGMVGPWRATN